MMLLFHAAYLMLAFGNDASNSTINRVGRGRCYCGEVTERLTTDIEATLDKIEEAFLIFALPMLAALYREQGIGKVAHQGNAKDSPRPAPHPPQPASCAGGRNS